MLREGGTTGRSALKLRVLLMSKQRSPLLALIIAVASFASSCVAAGRKCCGSERCGRPAAALTDLDWMKNEGFFQGCFLISHWVCSYGELDILALHEGVLFFL